MKQLLISSILALALLVLTQSVSANGQYGQYGQYGGVGPGIVAVDKYVRHPLTGDYVDNLGLADGKYRPEQTVFFRITVKNTGGTTLETVRVEDYLPEYVTFVAGGSYDAKTRIVRVEHTNLAPQETRTFDMQVKVLPIVKLPSAKAVVCPVNKVAAYTNELRDEDTAQFCIEKVAPAPVTPKTGDPMSLVLALGALPAAFAGWKLRRS